MSQQLTERLRALGSSATLPEVQALYAPLLERQARGGVCTAVDLAYAEHPRHRLDVYWPDTSEIAGPVLVMLHGGGFIRGDKSQRSSFGYWAARAGFVAVLPNYRLAPESRWPSGTHDVVSVWSWVRTNIHRYAGDPQRILLMGESAGAAHVASACLRREFQPAEWQIAAAVLISGPYNPRLEARARTQFSIATPDPRNDAYFGSEPTQLAEASCVDHVSAAPFPLLISFAERDLLQMQVQAAELFARLVTAHNYQPELVCIPDHNHYSQTLSFATDDRRLSGPLAEFVRKHA